jgi:DNA-binding LytR/AlgR family response regulator
MNVVIIEDEIANAEIIRSHLQKTNSKFTISAVLRSNREVREWFSQNTPPDLTFCDIELLDGNVFDALREDIIHCPIIFTTAYDSFYQEAFEQNGIAYLLKPVTSAKFSRAMEKYRNLGGGEEQRNWKALYEAVEKLRRSYKERLIVKRGVSMQLLHVRDVAFFTSREGKCIATTVNGKEYEFRYKLSDLAAELDPAHFFQINRGEIVNINYIEKIEPFSSGRLSLKVKDMDSRCIVSAAATPEFRQWLENQ